MQPPAGRGGQKIERSAKDVPVCYFIMKMYMRLVSDMFPGLMLYKGVKLILPCHTLDQSCSDMKFE